MNGIGTRLSILWAVVMFNMVCADILFFMKPGALQGLWAGQGVLGGGQVTGGLLLVFAIFLEIPIAMILVSSILTPRANRWANTVAAAITAAFVVGGGSLDLQAVFFEAVQVACMALIVWSMWSRRGSAAGGAGSLRDANARQSGAESWPAAGRGRA
jgi:hypothetical protein